MTSVGCEVDIANYISRGLDRDDPPIAIEMDSRAYLIALGLVRYWSGGGKIAEAPGALGPDRLRKAITYVEDSLGRDIRLAALAEAVGLSPFHFARLFKAESGETPAAYVTRRRVERAQELLRHTTLSISEIAFRLGFAHQSHLHRAFKKHFDETQGSVRKRDI